MSDAILRKNLIRLAHEHPEFRADLLPLLKEGGYKTAGVVRQQMMVGVVATTTPAVRSPHDPQFVEVFGKLSLHIPNRNIDAAPFLFDAVVREDAPETYTYVSFQPRRAVSGSQAEDLLLFYQAVFQSLLSKDPQGLLGKLPPIR